MAYLVIVTVLALLQFFYFGIQVGRARVKYGVPAPLPTGHEMFDRHFRVQMNTLEQLIMFVPSLWIFGTQVSDEWAAGLGLVYVIGRFVYEASYVRDPNKRGAGFGLTSLPTVIMLIGSLVWAVGELI